MGMRQGRGGSLAPTVMFRDLEVQKREGDLVCGTFGRGIFILDDYAALRGLTADARGPRDAAGPSTVLA